MRSLIRVFLAGLLCVGVAAVAVVWLLNLGSGASRPASPPGLADDQRAGREASAHVNRSERAAGRLRHHSG